MVHDLFAAILHHWKKALLLFLAIFGAVFAATYASPRLYRSQAKLLVRLGRENAILDPSTTIGQEPVVAVPYSREMEMNSITETIQSEVLLEQVIEHVGADVILGKAPPPKSLPDPVLRLPTEGEIASSDTLIPTEQDRSALHRSEPFQKALETLRKRLDVSALSKSNIISISFEGLEPDTAQLVVATLVDLAVDYHIHLHRSPKGQEFLTEQTTRLREKIDALQAKQQELKEITGLFYPEVQRQASVSRITKLQEEIALTKSLIEGTESEVALLRKQLTTLAPTQEVARTDVSNEAADTMRSQLFALQIRELDLLAKHPEGHPEVKEVRKQVEAARKILAQELESRERTTTGPNKLYEEAQLALLRQEPALQSLQAKLGSLEKQLQEEQDDLQTVNANDLVLSNLQREIDLHTTSYLKYAENVEQSQIDFALKQEKISNISVVQPANYNDNPTRPRWTINLAVGLALALMGSVSLAWISDSSRREQISKQASTERSCDEITSRT